AFFRRGGTLTGRRADQLARLKQGPLDAKSVLPRASRQASGKNKNVPMQVYGGRTNSHGS
ncbi:MAG: hypothetical protein ABI618_10345, partial [Nitrospirota bacterium]